MRNTVLILLGCLAFHFKGLAQKPERPTASDNVGPASTTATPLPKSLITPVVNDGDYFLTSVKVIVSTGMVAKSDASQLSILFGARPGQPPAWTGAAMMPHRGDPVYDPLNTSHSAQFQGDLPLQGKVALASGSVEQFDMITMYGQQYHGELGLSMFRSKGLRLQVIYSPGSVGDTWSLSQLTLVLEFRKQPYGPESYGEHSYWGPPGDPHPKYGRVLIPFSNLNLQMSEKNNALMLQADGNFKRL